jgi:hypothetical protein
MPAFTPPPAPAAPPTPQFQPPPAPAFAAPAPPAPKPAPAAGAKKPAMFWVLVLGLGGLFLIAAVLILFFALHKH